MSATEGKAGRALARHGIDDPHGLLAGRLAEIRDKGPSTPQMWRDMQAALVDAGVDGDAAFSALRTLVSLEDPGEVDHRILRDFAIEGDVRIVICACGAEVRLDPKAESTVGDRGYRISLFGPFDADGCHLAYGIFLKQLMSLHVHAADQA